MLSVPNTVLRRLRLEQAIQDEQQSWQSLMPPTPGWDLAVANAATLARWLSSQLLSGLPTVRHVVTYARKVPYGVRPVPTWGFAERITYRALVDFILRNEASLDRSAEAYLKFISSPVDYAQAIEPESTSTLHRTLHSSIINYVVKTDITAFYEYVDHGILARELLTKTGDNEAIECLKSLLAEVQGRSFGLPQLLDSSDRLSDVYIDIAERDLLRRSWPTWRFNDDFRIATRTFGETLAAIEELSAAVREIGLTLSDEKTATPRYNKYLFDNFGLDVEDEAPEELKRIQPEDAVGDYTEGIHEPEPPWAIERITKTYTPDASRHNEGEDGIDLSKVRGDDYRLLRRALGRLIREGIADALPHVLKLVAYVPALTPWSIRYVISAGSQHVGEAASTLDDIIAKVSLSDWQRLWIIHALDELGMLKTDTASDTTRRIEWVTALRYGRHSPAVDAAAALALAGASQVQFDDLEYALRDQPGALAPWYLGGIRRLREHGTVTNEQYSALQGEGGLFSALLPSQP